MNKKLVKGICLIAFGLGLVLTTVAQALANQITVCQSCTSATAGDPNVITDPSSFNMFVEGGPSAVNPTLVIVAELGGAIPTISYPAGGSDAPYALQGQFGLTLPGGTGVTYDAFSSSSDVLDALGLKGGNSLSFVNLVAGDLKNGFVASSYTLYAFALPTTLDTSPIHLDTTASAGSWIFGYGCQTTPTPFGTQCDSGNVVQTVNTNAGLVPEPSSLLLLGAGLVGIGIWSLRRKALKV